MARSSTLRGMRGFTVLELTAVLVMLLALAVLLVPKYLALAEAGRIRAAQGQIAEARTRLKGLLGGYLLANRGVEPLDGMDLMDYVAIHAPAACPNLPTVEGDFEFRCQGVPSATTVTVVVTAVQGHPLSPPVSGTFSF